MRYFIELAYNGAAYHGWQIQPNARTVQETLNTVLSTLLNRAVHLVGAGRTDTGVHAHYFVAHFDTAEAIESAENLIYKANVFLQTDIVIYSIRAVANQYHSRFDAISRTYKYYIHTTKNPFLGAFSYRLRKTPDYEKMNEACRILFHYTDFTSFSKSHTDTTTNLCEISEAAWQVVGNQLVFTISANRFLRNMVRAIVGTCLEVGFEKITLPQFRQIIESKNRSQAGVSVPGHALFLYDIVYADFKRSVDYS